MRNYFQEAFEKHKNNKYVFVPGEIEEGLTYGQVNNLASKLAAIFASKYSIKEGQRVSIIAGNRIEFIFAYYAIQKLKAIPTGINLRVSVKEANNVIKHNIPDKIAIIPDLADKYSEIISDDQKIVLPTYKELIELKIKDAEKFLDFHVRSDEDLLMIQYTSGTTGTPKGAMIKSNGWLSVSEKYAELLQFNESTRVLMILPLWQADGNIVTFALSVLKGASIILLPNFEDDTIKQYWDIAERLGGNYPFTVPGVLAKLLLQHEQNPRKSYPKLQHTKVSSSMLLPEVKDRFEKTFNVKVLENYGSTECNAITVSDPVLPDNGSVGKMAKIAPYRVDSNGMLFIKNDPWWAGYYKNEEQTKAAVTQDGWFKTVDFVEIKNDFLYIIGRDGDIINKFGEKIAPIQIDNVIIQNTNINECFTMAYRDRFGNDEIFSFAVPKNSKDINSATLQSELLRQCESNLPRHKVPKQIFLVDEIRLTPGGKPSKDDMKVYISSYLGN